MHKALSAARWAAFALTFGLLVFAGCCGVGSALAMAIGLAFALVGGAL